MDPTTTAVITAVSGTSSGGLFPILIILLLVIIPFIVKFWNWSKETSAQGMLYSQLSELVSKQRLELDAMYIARNVQQEQIFELRHKIEHLEGYESVVQSMKTKLDMKDQVIAERDLRIANLLDELLSMKDRLHYLEMRLKTDEEKFCDGCKYGLLETNELRSFKRGIQNE